MSIESQIYSPSSADTDEFAPYRAVSKAAVISVIFAVMGISGFFVMSLLVLPVLAIAAGVLALVNIRRYPAELIGRGAAISGIVLGMLVFISAVSYLRYIYVTEVPEGFDRLTFYEIKSPGSAEDSPPPPSVLDLDGKAVFMRGYVHPGVETHGPVSKFVLVGDMGICCFGGQPKITEMVEVTLAQPLKIEYSTRLRKLAGTFKLTPRKEKTSGDLKGGYYTLEASYLK